MAKKNSSTKNSSTARRRANAKSPTTRGGTTRGGATRRKSRTSSKRSSAKRQPPSLGLEQKALISGIVIIFVTAIIVLSLLSPSQGRLTDAVSDGMWHLFGWGGVIIPVFVGAIGFYLVLWGMEQAPALPGYRLSGVLLLFFTIEAFASLLAVIGDNGLGTVWEVAAERLGGGLIGGGLAWLTAQAVGTVGSILIWTILGIIAMILVSGVTRADLGIALRNGWALVQQYRQRLLEDRIRPAPDPAASLNRSRLRQPLLELGDPPERAQSGSQPAAIPAREGRSLRRRHQEQSTPAPAANSSPATTPASTEDNQTEPVPVILGAGNKDAKWKLPAVSDMLNLGGAANNNLELIDQQAEIIKHTLHSFGAPVEVVARETGPTVTQFGVTPQFIEMRNGKRTKVKVGKIASLADDLALALAAKSIRIQAPVPGKGYVGIEVPNPAKSLVSLRDIMESSAFTRGSDPLRFALGQNVSGQSAAASLVKMPHLLIAGATGAGKSVCVNSIIACLLLQYTPEELRFVMVDPKRVELTGYNGIPHLVAPVVVDTERVIGTLQWAMREMDSRYKKLAEVGSRNIVEFNRKADRRASMERLPYILIIIDELADLMMMSPEDTERAITRLAQMARATGIHMIISTQRPSVDVVTGLIKANFPARIAFAVSSSTDSRVILDSTGAERLLGQGDMLFQSPDAAAPVRLQGCWVSEEELERIINYWRAARRQNFISAPDRELTAPAEGDTSGGGDQPATASPPASQPASQPPASRTKAAPPRKNAGTNVEPQLASLENEGERGPAPLADVAREAADDAAAVPLPGASGEPALTADNLPDAAVWDDLIPEEPKEEVDELLSEAIDMVRKLDKASTSLLQRRFRIGYTRAARMIDVMEERGIIGPPTGTSKAREVLPWAENGNNADSTG